MNAPLDRQGPRGPAWTELNRRRFLGGTLGAALPLMALAGSAATPATNSPPAKAKPEGPTVKLGLIGCGGRGTWIAQRFQSHGGFVLHAVADYFEDVAAKLGAALGVDPARCFSGLSGYKRLLESGVEAVAIEDVPYFYPEQAAAAVAAGLHVYMAKPVAVDVPGCLTIGEAGRKATEAKRAFVVDYQLPSDPAMVEIGARVRDGGLGALTHIASFGFAWHAWPDPPVGANIESRLRDQIWLSDTALSGDTVVSYDIHLIDALVLLVGKRPVRACGHSRTCRAEPHGDRTDTASAIYEFDDGACWTHVTQSLDNNWDVTTLSAKVFGTLATAQVQYSGKVHLRGGPKNFAGEIGNVFDEGVDRNIATFHRTIAAGPWDNPTVRRAVDGTLTAILGREAAARRAYVTMDELIRENRRLVAVTKGMKD